MSKRLRKEEEDEYVDDAEIIEEDDSTDDDEDDDQDVDKAFDELYATLSARSEFLILREQNMFLLECVMTRFLLPFPKLGKLPLLGEENALNRLRFHIAIHDAIVKESDAIWSNEAHMEIVKVLEQLFSDPGSGFRKNFKTEHDFNHLGLVGYVVQRENFADRSQTGIVDHVIDAKTGCLRPIFKLR